MICEGCGTVFCWDDADTSTLAGSRRRFCSERCRVNAQPSTQATRRRRRRRLRQIKNCSSRGKKRYRDLSAALVVTARIFRKTGTEMYPYECACGWWHLSKEQRPPAPGVVMTGELSRTSADAELLDKAVRATKELIRADGDASHLTPGEIEVLTFYGCAAWEEGRLLPTKDWAESWNRREAGREPDAPVSSLPSRRSGTTAPRRGK